MLFEQILPELKQGAKVIRKGWSGLEEYVQLKGTTQLDGEVLTPYFVIKVTGEGYTMFMPSVAR